MNIEEKATLAKRLRADEAFQLFMEEVREDAIAAFTHSASHESEKREEAHAILRGLSNLDGAIASAINAKAVNDKKGQDRGHD